MLLLSWEDIIWLCNALAAKLTSYNIDVLVGVSRGGLVPVRLLSDMLGNSKIEIIKTEFYNGIGKTKGRPRITQELKKLLIISAVSLPGYSSRVFLFLASQQHPAQALLSCPSPRASSARAPE